MVALADADIVRAWKPPVAGLREVFHATFAQHAYPPHVHDVWTVFLVDDGAIRYGLDGTPRAADPTRVNVLPPHVVHDGRPASSRGFRKRVLYLETSLLGETLVGPAVDRPIVADASLRQEVSALHDALECADDLLESETRLAFVAERIGRSLGRPEPARPASTVAELAERLRAHLDGHLFEPMTMADAAAEIGATPTQLARAFSSAFGIPPHAYVIGRRLEAARDRILRGQDLAAVAAEVGFHDQAHLSRRFARFLGTTPGRFRAGARSVAASERARRAANAERAR
jgi:AraC-like DNA-binding protein